VLNEPSPICSLSPSRTCTVVATQKPLDVQSAAHEQHKALDKDRRAGRNGGQQSTVDSLLAESASSGPANDHSMQVAAAKVDRDTPLRSPCAPSDLTKRTVA
jgi:hypothetical protein